jgi:flagellin
MAGTSPFPVTLANGLQRTQAEFAQTAERLSSGNQADLVPESEAPFYAYLRTASAAYDRGTANAQTGIDESAAALGGTQVIEDALQELNGLANAASNDFLAPSDRKILQAQADAAVQQIGQVAGSASFNGIHLLAANTSITIQTGPYPTDTTQLSFPDVRPGTLGISNLDLTTTAGAQAALAAVNAALALLEPQQGQLGTQEHAMQAQFDANNTASTNLTVLASDMADRNVPKTIQQFKLEGVQESADLVTLAKAEKQADITLGVLDTTA